MAKNLLDLADNETGKTPSYVQLQAINSALDRAGITEQKQLEVTLKPFEAMLSEIESGSREDFRRQTKDERAGQLPAGYTELESADSPGGPPSEPTGVRVLGETPTGELVIDAELVDDAEYPASAGQGERDDHGQADYAAESQTGRRESMGNCAPTYMLPNGGYMNTEQALEYAAEANRLYRQSLNRG